MNDYITLRDVYDYFTCPYRIYLKRDIGMGQGLINHIFSYGKEKEKEAFEKLSKKYNILYRNLYLECKKLRLKGIIDGVISLKNGLAVFDIKAGDKLHNWYKMQVVAASILLECSKKVIVKEGMVYLAEIDKEFWFKIPGYLKRMVLNSLSRIINIYFGKEIPKKKEGSWCMKCEFKNYCKDLY